MFKKVLSAIIAVFIILLLCAGNLRVEAQGDLSVSAQASVLMCANTGEILYEKNADKRMPIASTTKIMTAILALEFASVDDKEVEFTADMTAEGSSMYLQVGDVVHLSDLVKGLMAASGNDAANAIAYAVAGSSENFADRMNDRAQTLGMENTHFVTPSGLDADEHYSTARDMAVLMSYAMENEDFAEITSQKSVRVDFVRPSDKRNTYSNHNRLLSLYDGCIGGKTGFTKTAGRCLVTFAQRDGIQLIAVTLDAPNDWKDHERLYDYGFDMLESKEYDDSKNVINVQVVGSENEQIRASAKDKVSIVSLVGSKQEPERIYQIPHFLYAPVAKGQKIGTIIYKLGDKIVASTDIISMDEAPAKADGEGFFSGIWRLITSWFE